MSMSRLSEIATGTSYDQGRRRRGAGAYGG